MSEEEKGGIYSKVSESLTNRKRSKEEKQSIKDGVSLTPERKINFLKRSKGVNWKHRKLMNVITEEILINPLDTPEAQDETRRIILLIYFEVLPMWIDSNQGRRSLFKDSFDEFVDIYNKKRTGKNLSQMDYLRIWINQRSKELESQ